MNIEVVELPFGKYRVYADMRGNCELGVVHATPTDPCAFAELERRGWLRPRELGAVHLSKRMGYWRVAYHRKRRVRGGGSTVSKTASYCLWLRFENS